MATVAECEDALRSLAAMLGGVEANARPKNIPARTLACEVPDLGTTFRGRISNAGLTDIAQGDANGAQIKLKVSSDDLVALARGKLNFAAAWATGRVKIDASIADLLRLRTLL